jgi:DNA-binding NarL/FixJ family response regulator
MARIAWDHPEDTDHALLVVARDDERRRALVEHLARLPGRTRADVLGRYPRFRIVTASTAEEARRRAGPPVDVAAIDIALPRRGGLALLRELRQRSSDLALLAYTDTAAASDGMAAMMAGADFFHDWREDPSPEGVTRAIDLAVERRGLTVLVERAETEVAAARGRLAQLSGNVARALPGFRQPHSREDVLPFREAARRYLLASARVFEGDARGLAAALGVSYFALRRLLARYDVPIPRSRK